MSGVCLLVVAWQVHADYSLIVAGNRDIATTGLRHRWRGRPTGPTSRPDAISRPAARGSVSLATGGSVVPISRSGATVTGGRAVARRLVPDYLLHEHSPAQFVGALEPTANRYAGFNLLLADRSSLVYTSNRTPRSPRTLAPGIYGLSNGELDEPWPKLVRTRARFTAAISGERRTRGTLCAARRSNLRNRTRDAGSAAGLAARRIRAVRGARAFRHPLHDRGVDRSRRMQRHARTQVRRQRRRDAGTETEHLLGALDRLRTTFRWKAGGLDAAGLRLASAPPR